MNLREILSNDLVKRLKNEAEVQGIETANSWLDTELYEEDRDDESYEEFKIRIIKNRIEYIEKGSFSASADIEMDYFFSSETNKILKEIFENNFNENDEDSFYDFLNEICIEFDLYRISENACEIQNNENIEELKKDI